MVYSLDRFGRTLIGALEIIERLHAEDKVFASVSDSFDITSDTGRLVLKIMLSLAEFERDRIKTRWRDAKNNAVLNRNVHISATPPYGYRRKELVNAKGNGYLGKLIIHPDEGPIVADIFERRAVGESYGSITRWLESTDAPSARGGGWNISTVQGIVANNVYLGIARGGLIGTPTNPDAHDPLTDPATWHAAQRAVAPRRASAKGTTHPALAAGLVRCATCRFTTSVTPNKGGSFNADGTGDFNYLCDRPWRGGGCERPATIGAATRMNGAPTVDEVIAERVLARLDTEPVGFREVDTLGEDLQALEEEWIAAHARADECSLDFDLEEQIGHDRWLKRSAALNQLAEEKLRALSEERHRVERRYPSAAPPASSLTTGATGASRPMRNAASSRAWSRWCSCASPRTGRSGRAG